MEILSQAYSVINSFALKTGLSPLDIIIFIVFVFYAIEGYSVGFIFSLFDFIGFVLSFIIALKFYSFFGNLLVANTSIPQGFANAVGFFIAAFLSEFLFAMVARIIHRRIPKEITSLKINKIFGFIPGIFSASVLLAFLLTLVLSLPLAAPLKRSISDSKIGSLLVSETSGLEKRINNVFGEAINDTLNFLTIEPKSDEFVKLSFKTSNTKVDARAEEKMLELLNKERVFQGLKTLVMDESLREVAREHSKDMFERGYFSHVSPDGDSPFDRMEKKGISYNSAGENLALAPSVEIAMKGLMESPGHRANMMSKDFGKIGIGAIDGGIYGVMFSQEFTD